MLTVVAELGQDSPYGVTWGEVLTHTAQRLQWNDPGFRLVLHDAGEIKGTGGAMERLARDLVGSQVTVLIGVQDPTVGAALSDLLSNEPTVLALGSSPELRGLTRLGGRQLATAPSGMAALLGGLLPGNAAAKADAQVLATVQELFERNTSDDLLFVFLVLINQYVREVPLVANSTKTQKAGMKELQCMVQKCGRQIFSCYADTSCRTALNCLNGCHFNDQVCSYRCIASYESPQLAEFSLCILQKHNCLGLGAEIPMTPDPAPLPSFNGQPMTHQLAEDLFIGFLRDPSSQLPASGKELFSWRVFGGKNPAYDYFPCQFQLFYRGKAKHSMWYDPVFMVKTLDGKMVWRRRHYRVKRGTTPGTFHLSVLDNGVTSKEYWRILDCAEDLEWCAFYYSGAAAAAGTSYSGAILGSRSGAWPDASQIPRIEQALERAGIKMWEQQQQQQQQQQQPQPQPDLAATTVPGVVQAVCLLLSIESEGGEREHPQK
ncbi:hypothetical protein N2152v2_008599 [Parachlorella kessleri]